MFRVITQINGNQNTEVFHTAAVAWDAFGTAIQYASDRMMESNETGKAFDLTKIQMVYGAGKNRVEYASITIA